MAVIKKKRVFPYLKSLFRSPYRKKSFLRKEAFEEDIMAENTAEAEKTNPECPCAGNECEGKCAEGAEMAEGQENTAETAEPSLAEKLEQAEKKIAENYDLYVRAMAEVENTRRRADAEVLKAQKFGVEKFASNLLPVIDSLEKALEHSKDSEDPLKEGLEAIQRQLLHAMEVSGMKRFDPKGEKFDPNLHQAVTVVPAAAFPGLESGTVADVFQKGWMIQERVLRPAMVAVVQG